MRFKVVIDTLGTEEIIEANYFSVNPDGGLTFTLTGTYKPAQPVHVDHMNGLFLPNIKYETVAAFAKGHWVSVIRVDDE